MRIIELESTASKEELSEALEKALRLSLQGEEFAIGIKKEKAPTTYDFGEVIKATEKGYIAYRTAWDNKGGNFVFKQIPAEIPIITVPNMQSLPNSVKSALMDRFKKDRSNESLRSIRYSNQWAMVHPDNKIYGWQPSAADLAATDWVITK